jgi:alkylation response protein AidB-like acyl-CoA dehydrogenase
MIQQWAEDELEPHAQEWETSGFPDSVFKRAGDLGILGIGFDPSDGGQGGDLLASLMRIEGISHSRSGGLGLGLAVQTDMTLPMLQRWGTPEQKDFYLRPALEGAKIACLGITEPDAGSDVAGIRSRAVKKNDGWVINGSKMYITNGCRADFMVLLAKTDQNAGHHGLSIFLLDMKSEGVTVSRSMEKMGMWASDTAEITFEDVFIHDELVLGEVGRGFYQISAQLQHERLIGAMIAVSNAERLLESTVEHITQRHAFGKRLLDMQAVQHHVAYMATDLEAARQLTLSVAWRTENGQTLVRETSMAKLFATQKAVSIADTCIQLHGGFGYLRESGIERLYRDLRLHRIGGGADEIMLDIIGKSYLPQGRR